MKTDDSQLKLETKGVWIPICIWDNKDLTLQEKAVLVKVESFKECFASNDYLAEFVNVSVSRVKQVLKSLEDKGYIYRVVQRKEKAIVKRIISVDKAKFYGIAVETGSCPDSDIGQETAPSKGRKLPYPRTRNCPDNSKANNKAINKDLLAPHGECAPDPVTVEQLPAKPKPAPKKIAAKELNYSGWPDQPAPQILADWLASRKNLRAAVTQTVINRLANELHKAAQAGYTVDDCLGLACERGWRGIKAEWVINANSSNQNLGVNHANGRTNHERRSEVDAAINNWQDTSWAHDLIHGDNPKHY